MLKRVYSRKEMNQSHYIMYLFRELSLEKELVLQLQNRYSIIGKDSRPVRNASKPVQVKYGLGLIQMDLNEREKVLSMSMWSRYVSIM